MYAKKAPFSIERYLEDRVQDCMSESYLLECEADEYQKALERFQKSGSLPRDIRNEVNMARKL